MVGKILIDTNVLLDYLLEREPFFEDAKKVISSCTEGNTKGCVAAHSISNMFFILRKDYTAKERREILSNLCTIFDVEGIDKAKLLSGLANEEFSDFEDSFLVISVGATNSACIFIKSLFDTTILSGSINSLKHMRADNFELIWCI